MVNTQTTEHRSGVHHDDSYTLALLDEKRKITYPQKNKNLYKMEKNGNDYRDMILLQSTIRKSCPPWAMLLIWGFANVAILIDVKALPRVFQSSVVSY